MFSIISQYFKLDSQGNGLYTDASSRLFGKKKKKKKSRKTPTISIELNDTTTLPTDTNGSELAGPEIIAEVGESSTEIYRGTIILNSTNATEGEFE